MGKVSCKFWMLKGMKSLVNPLIHEAEGQWVLMQGSQSETWMWHLLKLALLDQCDSKILQFRRNCRVLCNYSLQNYFSSGPFADLCHLLLLWDRTHNASLGRSIFFISPLQLVVAQYFVNSTAAVVKYLQLISVLFF